MPMNDKQRFLDELSAALSERGISDADIAPYMEQFDKFYDRMLTDNAQTASVLDDVEGIADNIAAQVSDKYDAINRLAEKTMTVDAVTDIDFPAGDDEVDDGYDLPTAETDAVALDGEYDDEYGELIEETDAPPLIPAEMLEDIESEEAPIADEAKEFTESTRLPDYVPDEEIGNSKMFWILFAVSLPITVPLALLAVGIFAAVWAVLGALIVGAIAALAAAVAGGTGLSLIGIIYGAVQMFTSIPVGLYEIGAGIIVAGAVMFIGILLYNFAVRLVPVLIKQVWRLFRYLLGRLKELFNFLRKESAKL